MNELMVESLAIMMCLYKFEADKDQEVYGGMISENYYERL